jgi:hypothetical protein
MNGGIIGLEGGCVVRLNTLYQLRVSLPFMKDDLRVIRKSDLARFVMFLHELGKAAINGISPYR